MDEVTDEVTLRRLLFSKRLFNHGVRHSNKNTELDRFLAIHHFDKVFASSLIEDSRIKEALIESEKYMGENNFKKSMESSAKAFHYLLVNECQDRSSKLGHIASSGHSFSWNLSASFNSVQFDNNLKKFAKEINKQFNEIDRRLKESIRAIEEEFSLLKLGINYKEYMRFYEISPKVYIYNSGMRIRNNNEEYYTEENSLFCHEFVLDAALSLQGMTTK